MALSNDHMIVLKRTRYNEDDFRIFVLLKDQGKALLTIKGGLRFNSKLKSFADPFTEADVQIFLPPQKIFGRLISGKLIQSQGKLTSPYTRFELACRMAEIVDLLLPFRAPSPEVFDILRLSLRLLTSGSPLLTEIYFVMQILKILGHGDFEQNCRKILGGLDPDEDDNEQKFDGLLAEEWVNLPCVPEAAVECRRYLERNLEQILPSRLKS